MFSKRQILLLLFFIIFIRFFSYIGWNNSMTSTIGLVMSIVFLFYTLGNLSYIKSQTSIFSTQIWLLAFIPFFSYIPALVLHDQSILDSFRASGSRNLMYLTFFVLMIRNYKEEEIIKVVMAMGAFWAIIQIVQQFTFPKFWFSYSVDEDMGVQVRNGIYRFAPFGREFGLLFVFISFVRYIKEKKTIYLLALLLGVVGVYLTVTRQIVVAVLIAIIYGLHQTKVLRSKSSLIFIVFALVLYSNMDILIGDFAEMTDSNLSNDYSRFNSYLFYGLEYNQGNLLAFLFGNGDPCVGSNYFSEIENFQRNFGLWRSDIGVVGMYSSYGIIYMIPIITFFYTLFKYRKFIDLEYQMFGILVLLTSVMLWHFGHTFEHVVPMACVYYLMDLSYRRNTEYEIVC